MNIASFRLLTDNFTEALHFWHDLVGLPISYSDDSIGYAYFLITEGFGMEIFLRTQNNSNLDLPSSPQPGTQHAVITVRVDNVESTYTDLTQKGYLSLSEPADRPAWNSHLAHIQAPDGYILELYSPLPTTP